MDEFWVPFPTSRPIEMKVLLQILPVVLLGMLAACHLPTEPASFQDPIDEWYLVGRDVPPASALLDDEPIENDTTFPGDRALERYLIEQAVNQDPALPGVQAIVDDTIGVGDRTIERYRRERAPSQPTPLLNDFMTPSTRPAEGTDLAEKLQHGRIPKARAFEQW